MKKVRFSNHALLKIKVLESHGFKVDETQVKDCLNSPDKIVEGYRGRKRGRKIAQNVFDETHVIRVVYEESSKEILVITLYPGRKERYEKN